MSGHFNYIVVGRGMMGAAAARHLAETAEGVALIGPVEPADIKTHQGVFASHYDEARITRTIDGDADWALLANRSIARYADIAARSGVEFYAPVGCLMVGPERGGDNPFVDDVCKAAARLDVSTELLDGQSLENRFPYFTFEPGCEGVFERNNAGYVNPRALVKAQTILAEKAGITLIDDIVVSTREEGGRASVQTASGAVYTADRVLVATGGFSIMEDLLPQSVALNVYARTVAFFEIDEGDLAQYADMPSLIYEPRDTTKHIYLLPPVRYPDGKFYLKIGGDPDDKRLGSDPEIREWFRSGGRESVRDHLSDIVGSLVPSIDLSRISMAACVVSKTQSGYPAIGFTASPHIAVLTGGNGTAAKSSDEIGRLGALLLRDGQIADGAFSTDFKPAFL
ncbi:FAD-dependent oxidoreductase [Agrobacterium salinitolerans]|uniref:FAD-dependent oxidoreductase n=1 Tax=Agrobacterium salinitolerans TaxID=1183413 RepID=A0A9X3KPG1_9HYPH|nr:MULTISPECIES: FAD-dependent oxidoreductase [Agrobacterium]MCZ7851280.1 FAD-dependent oxidoreductase [Agrobacterium salinitolerans]MCZ7890312.1 FAD-dependent oxidoreductase [Agrobacterium salinitolerans]MCZ7938594.1 FAD-dependent oxidoreductase [Agrobacterium salinitolerans]MCZ7974007.1 FAD-dependent oxidoreductase [Agrobacterium salinitolerans]TRA96958.1 FAD-dependent oxidoreductase [Agrobacterium salinitolerans]